MPAMRKRTIWTTIAAIVVAVVVGVIVFRWREHGHQVAYGDVPTWLTFTVVVIGLPATLYQLYLQRRQLASQQAVIEGEVARNKRRDALLDGQLRELEQRAVVTERAQAEQVVLSWQAHGGCREPVCTADP
jgi:hypothetical protein